MRRFDQDALLDRMAHRGALTPQHIDALARDLARFHAGIEPRRARNSARRRASSPALQNFAQMRELVSRKRTSRR